MAIFKNYLLICLFALLSILGRTNSNYLYITKNTLLYSEPDQRFGRPVAQLVRGLKVSVMFYNTEKPWIMVTTPKGREGWIQKNVSSTKIGREPVVANHQYQPRKSLQISPKEKPQNNSARDIASTNLPDKLDGETDFQYYKRKLTRTNQTRTRARARTRTRQIIKGQSQKSFKKYNKNECVGGECLSDFFSFAGIEYANQLNVDATSGFGFQLGAGYYFWDDLALGLVFNWNNFSDETSDFGISISRDPTRIYFGLLTRFNFDRFLLDSSLGWEKMNTTLLATDSLGNQIPIPVGCSGSTTTQTDFSDSAIGISITPAYRVIKINKNLGLDIYGQLSATFYGGNTLICGQGETTLVQGSAGIRFNLGF